MWDFGKLIFPCIAQDTKRLPGRNQVARRSESRSVHQKNGNNQQVHQILNTTSTMLMHVPCANSMWKSFQRILEERFEASMHSKVAKILASSRRSLTSSTRFLSQFAMITSKQNSQRRRNPTAPRNPRTENQTTTGNLMEWCNSDKPRNPCKLLNMKHKWKNYQDNKKGNKYKGKENKSKYCESKNGKTQANFVTGKKMQSKQSGIVKFYCDFMLFNFKPESDSEGIFVIKLANLYQVVCMLPTSSKKQILSVKCLINPCCTGS